MCYMGILDRVWYIYICICISIILPLLFIPSWSLAIASFLPPWLRYAFRQESIWSCILRLWRCATLQAHEHQAPDVGARSAFFCQAIGDLDVVNRQSIGNQWTINRQSTQLILTISIGHHDRYQIKLMTFLYVWVPTSSVHSWTGLPQALHSVFVLTDILCCRTFLKSLNRHGTRQKVSSFFLSSRPDPIGDRNDVRELPIWWRAYSLTQLYSLAPFCFWAPLETNQGTVANSPNESFETWHLVLSGNLVPNLTIYWHHMISIGYM